PETTLSTGQPETRNYNHIYQHESVERSKGNMLENYINQED
ncbi:12734_t:CDS:1, partial [Acaulospora morrowiae]